MLWINALKIKHFTTICRQQKQLVCRASIQLETMEFLLPSPFNFRTEDASVVFNTLGGIYCVQIRAVSACNAEVTCYIKYSLGPCLVRVMATVTGVSTL